MSEEHPLDELDEWCAQNWSRVDEETRLRCAMHLRDQIDPEALAKWRDQAERGVSIGSDDPWFHMGAGMAVRNTLRDVLYDDRLPPVLYDHIQSEEPVYERNWDDFYSAALLQAVLLP